MSKISDYMTVGEAAEYLGVSTDSLRRWDRSGRLVARRHPASRYRLYLREDLDVLLRTLREGPSAQERPINDEGIR